jgi:hypothetical protein
MLLHIKFLYHQFWKQYHAIVNFHFLTHIAAKWAEKGVNIAFPFF